MLRTGVPGGSRNGRLQMGQCQSMKW